MNVFASLLRNLLYPNAVTEIGEASIGDDNFPFLQKDVLCVQVFVYYPSSMEIAHGLGHLVSYVEAFLKRARLRPDMDFLVEGLTFAKAVCVNVGEVNMYVCMYVCVCVCTCVCVCVCV